MYTAIDVKLNKSGERRERAAKRCRRRDRDIGESRRGEERRGKKSFVVETNEHAILSHVELSCPNEFQWLCVYTSLGRVKRQNKLASIIRVLVLSAIISLITSRTRATLVHITAFLVQQHVIELCREKN